MAATLSAIRVPIQLLRDVEGEANRHPRAAVPTLRAAYNATTVDREGTTGGSPQPSSSSTPSRASTFSHVVLR